MSSYITILIILSISVIFLALLLSYFTKVEEYFENNVDVSGLNKDNIQSVTNDNDNYTIIRDKLVKGERLQGTHVINDMSITFDEYGRPIGQIMSVEKSKKICDILGDKCAGFIIQGNNDKSIANYFISIVQQGFEQPNNDENTHTEYKTYTSYIKNLSQ
jgi:hypothetical protein